MAEQELTARIAWFYYHDGLTQGEIGDLLGLSRLKVSRLLEKGRQSGLIRVQINSRYEGCLQLEDQLLERFGLQFARVLPALPQGEMNQRIGVGAAQALMTRLRPQQLLAVGFGDTAMSTLQHLSGFISSQQIRLVTLSGGVGPYMTGIGQLDAACGVSIIPAPLRASSADVAAIFRRERSVHDVLLTACAADIAVVGIGALSQKHDATIMRSGYISEGEQQLFVRKGAVGDILGYFMRRDGELAESMPLHNELIGISLTDLSSIPLVIGVAGGPAKAESILAALAGQRINALVSEESTVRAVLALL
ncbi:transcriptional regulator LsrR [Martelella alba]|uniref:Transcriptional regulator LsrR n=2 Tax=Martelella alba TaxID=2590451 RepID=A0ABY2SKQ6_9HYPH|nr:transcriptional regulator LsrR [Martelella alba]